MPFPIIVQARATGREGFVPRGRAIIAKSFPMDTRAKAAPRGFHRHAIRVGRVHGQLELCLRIRRGVELHARRHQLLINLSQEVREDTLSDLGFLTKVLEFAAMPGYELAVARQNLVHRRNPGYPAIGRICDPLIKSELADLWRAR